MRRKFLSRIRNDFVAGLLVILPAILTFIILKFLIANVDSLILKPIVAFFHFANPPLIFLIKMALFLCLILAITLIGFATRIVITRRVLAFIERLLSRVPMVNKIYGTIKEVCAFFRQDRGAFRKVVLIEYPRKGMYAIGFITSEAKGEAQMKTEETIVNVFVPTTPNPTTGMLLLVPKEQIIPLDMSVEDGMKMVVSGGILTPAYGDTKDRSNSPKEA